MANDLSRQLRLLLTNAPDAPSLPSLLETTDSFVVECSESSDPSTLLHQLEEELQTIYHEVIDHSVFAQTKSFLSVLYRLHPVIPPSSLISTWFDIVLRPALREPKLPVEAVNHAKDLIIAALNPAFIQQDAGLPEEEKKKRKEKMLNFRRRLMDLYLLDAYNESSGDDVLEWVELNDTEKERKACWKANLEDVLVRIGLQKPQDLLTEVYHCFVSPSSRLQLLILLNAYTSQPNFPSQAAALAAHPLMQSIINSLVLDNSSTECTIGLMVLTKLLPVFAVKACEDLKRLLPSLFVVLARVVSWKKRQQDTLPDITLDTIQGQDSDVLIEPVIEDKRDTVYDNNNYLKIRKELQWERLEMTFTGSTTAAPSSHQYFAFLYYLFPCNTLRFLRYPVPYLKDAGLESPYTISWDDALDEGKIRSKSESLLRGHVLHPLLIWRDAAEELAKPDFWTKYDIPRIVAECAMLDVRSASLGLREQLRIMAKVAPGLSETSKAAQSPPVTTNTTHPEVYITSEAPFDTQLSSSADSAGSAVIKNMRISEPLSRPRISLQDMISTSVTLKSGLDVDIVDTTTVPSWPSGLFESTPLTRSPSRSGKSAVSMRTMSPEPTQTHETEDGVPSHVALAIATLQREVLILRSDLNFELWMARENVRHIGRLYQDRVVSRTAEVERQALHNRLREYKSEVYRLQKDLREQKEQALKVKNQYVDWNRNLQDKIREHRTEKSRWQAEATAMRAADKEAKATFAAQSKLLAAATHKVFQLETQIKENAHKVDRLHDYERQIEQLIKLQWLWEIDLQKLNDQTETMQARMSKYKKMELRLDAHEKRHMEMEELTRAQRQEIESLEAKVSVTQKQLAVSRKAASKTDFAQYHIESRNLAEANKRLRDENSDLREQVEEMHAMAEELKSRMGHTVADPRASPLLVPRFSL